MKTLIVRPSRAAAVVAVVFATAGGIAYATVPDSVGVFNACMLKATGTIRLVDPSAPAGSLLSHPCSATLETPISFNQRGQQGPAGESVHAYRVNRGAGGEIRVTGIGQGPNGFPTDTHTGLESTDITSLALPQGAYYIHWSVNVLKESGDGIFTCLVGDKVADVYTGIARTALGVDPGFARWASLSAPGFVNVPAGGATLTLLCFQSADNAVAGTPSGESPDVYQGNINVLKVGGASITNAVTGATTEIP
jgi:hypothetical protein